LMKCWRDLSPWKQVLRAVRFGPLDAALGAHRKPTSLDACPLNEG
jgi:hypothetical protein